MLTNRIMNPSTLFLRSFFSVMFSFSVLQAEVQNEGFLGGPFHGISSDSSGSIVNQVGPIVDLVDTLGLSVRTEKSKLSDGESSIVSGFFRLDDGTMTALSPSEIIWSVDHPELFIADGFATAREISNRARVSLSAESGGHSARLYLRLIPGQTIEEVIEKAELPKVLESAVDFQVANWKQSNWFGTFYPGENNWIHHQHHGWMYATAGDPGSIWLWSENLDWLWTGPGVYPHLYRNKDASWLYFMLPALPRKIYYNQTAQTFEEQIE